MKRDLLGINVNIETKEQILSHIQHTIAEGEQLFIVTPYSEFFQRCFRDQKFRTILNSADVALPDGIGTVWLAYYLSLQIKSKNFYTKILEAFWQMFYSLCLIVVAPQKIRTVIPDKISGSDFFWDLLQLASEQNLKVFLLGGFSDTPNRVMQKALEKYPNTQFVGVSNANPSNTELIDTINQSGADVLMVAFGPVKQEFWISENLKKLNVKVAIGLGGTFDYVAGKQKLPPEWIRYIGLEWLYRLFSQPHRYKRIFNATCSFLIGTIRFKVWNTMELRKNVVGVIINTRKELFIASRILDPQLSEVGESPDHWQFPQGGVDKDEDLEKAVLREVYEETGITSVKILGAAKQTNTYIWNNTLRPLLFNSRPFKGQEQKIYFLKFTGEDSEIALDNLEFKNWKWVSLQNLQKTIHPFRLPLAKIILEEISNYES